MKSLRAITMLSTFTPDSRYENNILKPIGNVHSPNEMCSGELFNLSAEAALSELNARPTVRCVIFPLRNKQIRYLKKLLKVSSF